MEHQTRGSVFVPLLLILIGLGIGATVGYSRSSQTTVNQQYQADALLMIQMGREVSSSRAELVAAGETRRIVAPGWREFLNTEVTMLRHPALHRAVFEIVKRQLAEERHERRQALKESGGDPSSIPEPQEESIGAPSGIFPATRDYLLKAMALNFEALKKEIKVDNKVGNISITLVPRSNLLRLQCTSGDRRFAKLVLHHLIKLYFAFHVASYSQTDSIHIWQSELKVANEALNAAEKALTDYRLETGVFDLETERTSLIDERVRLAARVRELEAARSSAEARASQLEANNGDSGRISELRADAAAAAAEAAQVTSNVDAVNQRLAEVEATRGGFAMLEHKLLDAQNVSARLAVADRIAATSKRLDDAGILNVRVIAQPSINPQPVMLLGLPKNRIANTILGGFVGAVIIVLLLLGVRTIRQFRSA